LSLFERKYLIQKKNKKKFLILPLSCWDEELFFGASADVCRECCLTLLLLIVVDAAERERERESNDFTNQSCAFESGRSGCRKHRSANVRFT